MRDVAVVSFAERPPVARERERNEVELVAPVVTQATEAVGLTRRDIGFVCSGSSDYLVGRPFSFVAAVAGLGPWPPMRESHVEMDGAWALYEAWVRLQHGDIDTALVYAFGKSSLGDLNEVLVQQLDPYYMAPLGADAASIAGLQAQAMVDAGLLSDPDVGEITTLDGASAVVLATGDRARALCERPAWIRGIDHRIEPHSIGARDLTRSVSAALAADRAKVRNPQAAYLHTPFAHQAVILEQALGTGDAEIHTAGGPMMVAGLSNIGAAARAIHSGEVDRAVAHATSGPCLQQNLVAMLEAS